MNYIITTSASTERQRERDPHPVILKCLRAQYLQGGGSHTGRVAFSPGGGLLGTARSVVVPIKRRLDADGGMPRALQVQAVPVAGVGGVVLQEFGQVTWKTVSPVTRARDHCSFPDSEQEDLGPWGGAGWSERRGREHRTPDWAWSRARGASVTVPGLRWPVGRLGGPGAEIPGSRESSVWVPLGQVAACPEDSGALMSHCLGQAQLQYGGCRFI